MHISSMENLSLPDSPSECTRGQVCHRPRDRGQRFLANPGHSLHGRRKSATPCLLRRDPAACPRSPAALERQSVADAHGACPGEHAADRQGGLQTSDLPARTRTSERADRCTVRTPKSSSERRYWTLIHGSSRAPAHAPTFLEAAGGPELEGQNCGPPIWTTLDASSLLPQTD